MRYLLGLTLLVGLLGCPRAPAQQGASADGFGSSAPAATADGKGQLQRVAVAFSATESDPWTSELIDALGAELGLDLWQRAGAAGSLDVYGPYQLEFRETDLEISLCLSGFTGVVDLPGQEALAAQVRAWLDEQQPDAVWLDGDPLQFQVGRHLPADWPVVFTGVVLDRTLYYTPDQRTTGVYRRHSLPRILREIWRADSNATRYGLLSDNSPTSMGRVMGFVQLEAALPEGHELYASGAARSWAELKQQIKDLGEYVDAAVICGAGEERASKDFQENPCPDDLLAEARFPVVVLSPSKADHSGAISLRIKPAAAVAVALDQLVRVLRGTDPRALPVVTPDDMAVFLAVGEKAAAAAEGNALSGQPSPDGA